MSVIIKLISANLTRDSEKFGRMVNLLIFRILTSKYFLEDSNSDQPSAETEAVIPSGTTLLPLIRQLIPL